MFFQSNLDKNYPHNKYSREELRISTFQDWNAWKETITDQWIAVKSVPLYLPFLVPYNSVEPKQLVHIQFESYNQHF